MVILPSLETLIPTPYFDRVHAAARRPPPEDPQLIFSIAPTANIVPSSKMIVAQSIANIS